MTHNPFDEFAKSLVVDRQAFFGHAETECELTRDALYADLAWEPDRSLLPKRARDLVDRMARIAALWECAHHPPDFLTAVSCVEKVRAWQRKRVARAKARGHRPPSRAPLWLICAGTPRKLRLALSFTPMTNWPRGFYRGPEGSALRLVLVRELPVRADTLLLRLMGAGAVLRRAVAEVEALPDDAEERIIALRHIERIARIRARTEQRRMDGKQFVAETHAAHRAWTEKVEARAMKKGIEKGLRIAVVAFCEAAGIALDDDRRAWIERANATELDARLATLRATRVWT
ncbi:MAG: hypothetical protein U0326_42535 [Polyangiales bacterium]